MSESVFPASENRAPVPGSVAHISGGEMLRVAREAQGLHISALASSLKVPLKKLEALEADRFDLLPDTVFVRALASSICRTLKIDPDPVLERFPHKTAPPLRSDESGINAPFRGSGDRSGLPFMDQFSNPFVLAVSVLLVGVVVLAFFPFAQMADVSSEPQAGTAAVVSSLPPPAAVPLATENPAATDGAATPTQSSSVALLVSNAPLAMIPAGAASTASSPVPAASALAVTVPGSGAATGMVVFKAHGVSWIEVIDAGGVVQVRKTIADGEVLGASGVMPLSVVVGRADSTEVQVRGKPLDLTRIARDNVARFEVK